MCGEERRVYKARWQTVEDGYAVCMLCCTCAAAHLQRRLGSWRGSSRPQPLILAGQPVRAGPPVASRSRPNFTDHYGQTSRNSEQCSGAFSSISGQCGSIYIHCDVCSPVECKAQTVSKTQASSGCRLPSTSSSTRSRCREGPVFVPSLVHIGAIAPYNHSRWLSK